MEPKLNPVLNNLFFKLQKSCVVVNKVKSKRHSLNYIITLYILNGETGPCFRLWRHFVAEKLCIGLWKKAKYKAVKQRLPLLAAESCILSVSQQRFHFFFFAWNACVTEIITTASSTIFFSQLFPPRCSAWSHFLCKYPGFTIWWCVARVLCCN